MKTKAIVVDGHASVRQMLTGQLQQGGLCEVVGEATTGFEALALFRKKMPALVMLEVILPEMDGIEVARQLRRQAPDLRVLFYSGTLDNELILEALRECPHGFVHKSDTLATLLEAVRVVTRGCTYFTPLATSLLVRPGGWMTERTALSGRERTILKLLAEGLSNKEMALKLNISSKTVEYHRSRLMTKLGLHDIARLTRYAVQTGLVAAG
jgi:DNA-binding NarL/FixJ family response regulator